MAFPRFEPDIEPSSVGMRWSTYKMRFNNFLVASTGKNISEIDDGVKKAKLLYCVGERAFEMYETVQRDTDTYEDVIKAFDQMFISQINTEYEKYVFSQAKQHRDEPFDAFVSRLRLLAKNCGYGDELENEIKSRIIQGCYSEQLRVKALTDNPSPVDLIKLGRSMEAASRQAQDISEQKWRGGGRVSAIRSTNRWRDEQNIHHEERVSCKNCGFFHIEGECPAYGKQCYNCEKYNHYARKCRNNSSSIREDRISLLTTENKTPSDGYVFGIREQRPIAKNLPTTRISINGNSKIEAYIDTCSTVNVISESTFRRLRVKPYLRPVQTRVWNYYGGIPIKFIGQFEGTISWGCKSIQTTIAVVRGERENILSYDTCDRLGIVRIRTKFVHQENKLKRFILKDGKHKFKISEEKHKQYEKEKKKVSREIYGSMVRVQPKEEENSNDKTRESVEISDPTEKQTGSTATSEQQLRITKQEADLKSTDGRKLENVSKASNNGNNRNNGNPSEFQPRRTIRTTKPVKPIIVDPFKKSYDEAT